MTMTQQPIIRTDGIDADILSLMLQEQTADYFQSNFADKPLNRLLHTTQHKRHERLEACRVRLFRGSPAIPDAVRPAQSHEESRAAADHSS
jgi:hypothetical protein